MRTERAPDPGTPLQDRLADTVFASSWQALTPASALYEIEPAQPAGAVFRRESRRDAVTGLREDTIVLGHFEDGRSHLTLTLERGSLPSARLGLFVDLSRRAAPAGFAILRMGPLETLATKFGEAEVASVTLAGASERACLAFRWSDPEQGFSFKGWHCPTDPAAARSELACLIDRLGVTPVADRLLRAWFAQVDGRRNPACRSPSASFASRSSLR